VKVKHGSMLVDFARRCMRWMRAWACIIPVIGERLRSMSGFDDSLRKIVDAQHVQGVRFHKLQALMSALRDAVENCLGEAPLLRHPVTRRPVVLINTYLEQKDDALISIEAFDGTSIFFRLLPTGVLEVTTPDFCTRVADFTARGRQLGVVDVDFVTAGGKRFGLRELLDRFFKALLDDLEEI